MPLASFLAAVCLSSQGPSVSLSIAGARLPVALEQIERITGQPLRVSKDLTDEVICLRLDNVPLKESLDRIASAVGGRWSENGSVLRLVPSPKFEREQWQRIVSERLKGLRGAAADAKEELAKQTPIDAKLAGRWRQTLIKALSALSEGKDPDISPDLSSQLPPPNRLLRRMIVTLPLQNLAGLPDGARIVYSSRPNGLQLPLPPSTYAALSAFQREQQVWDRELAPNLAEALLSMKAIDEFASKILSPVGFDNKVDLVVHFDRGTGQGSLELKIVNSSGLAQNYDAITISSGEGEDEEKPKDSPKAAKSPLPKDAVEEEFLKVTSSRPEDVFSPDRTRLLAQWRGKLIDPATNEPLAFYPGRRLLALAERLQVNLVACLPEHDISSYRGAEIDARPTQLLDHLKSRFDISRESGWIVLRPASFPRARGLRLNRQAAGVFFRHVSEKGAATIDDAADLLATAITADPFTFLPPTYVPALVDLPGRAMLPGTSLGLKLYGYLSTEQRRGIRSHPIPLRELPESGKAYLRDLVYRDDFLSENGDDVEPTEALPNGIPADAEIGIASETVETVVIPAVETNEGISVQSGRLTAVKMGRALAGTVGNANEQQSAATMRGYRSFIPGTLRTLKLKLTFSPILSREITLREANIPLSKPVPFDRLPEAFRAAVEAARKLQVKSLQEKAAEDGGSPPPPGRF